MTRVDIISGFLGAGKTTLIKKLLQEAYAGEKVVLIENEFGEIGIDGGFLKEAGIEITEMNSGCICCSLVGDFGAALADVLAQFSPDRVIIEPSGVGKLSDVVKAVEKVKTEVPNMEIGSLVTVADAKKCKMYMKNFGEFYNNQIESARTIILSRTGDLGHEKVEAAAALLREKNPHAVIVTTDWSKISGMRLREAMEQPVSLEEEMREDHHHHHDHECGCGCGHDHEHDHHHHHDHECGCDCGHDHEHEHHHHHDHECSCGCGHDHDHEHHHADDVFISWGKETAKQFAEQELRDILDELQDSTDFGVVLRAKGIVALTDGTWAHFDLVPGEYELRRGAADYTGRLCVIGSDLNTGALTDLFRL